MGTGVSVMSIDTYLLVSAALGLILQQNNSSWYNYDAELHEELVTCPLGIRSLISGNNKLHNLLLFSISQDCHVEIMKSFERKASQMDHYSITWLSVL